MATRLKPTFVYKERIAQSTTYSQFVSYTQPSIHTFLLFILCALLCILCTVLTFLLFILCAVLCILCTYLFMLSTWYIALACVSGMHVVTFSYVQIDEISHFQYEAHVKLFFCYCYVFCLCIDVYTTKDWLTSFCHFSIVNNLRF